MLEDDQVKMLTLDLLKNKSDRDKQSMIGASEIGNECDYCVANRLLGNKQKANRYWLGAKLGTALHRELEHEEEKYIGGTTDYRFVALAGARVEQSIFLREIAGRIIRSKPDLVLVKEHHLIDWKGSSKIKVQKYKLDGVPYQYIVQQTLYAEGLILEGIDIERISLVFINRDGSGDDDVWVHSFDYDQDIADKAWERLSVLAAYVDAGNDVETIASDPKCWYCNNVLRRF